MELTQIIVQSIMALLTLLAGAGFIKSRRDRRRTDIETDATAAGAWQQIAAERKAERLEIEAKFAKLEVELTAMKLKISELDDALRDFKDKYRHAVAYIRRLVGQLQRHVDPESIDPPPAEISADL